MFVETGIVNEIKWLWPIYSLVHECLTSLKQYTVLESIIVLTSLKHYKTKLHEYTIFIIFLFFINKRRFGKIYF